MVKFELTAGGYRVVVDHKPVGYIYKGRGFFITPSTVRQLTEISTSDLRRIADKVDDIQDQLTLQDKLVLRVLSESSMIMNAIINSFIGIMTRAEVEASVEKLERLGKVERISSGKDPMYTTRQVASA